jgi:hypothetical protein
MLLHARLATTFAAGLLVVACLAGCGSGSKDAATAGETTASPGASNGLKASGGGSVPREQFIARADAICRTTNARLARTTPKGRSPAQIAAAVGENETIERSSNGRLAQLTAPSGLASTWAKMLGYRHQLANQLGSLAAATRRHATAPVKLLSASKKRVHGELRQLATRAGFKDCAKVGSR